MTLTSTCNIVERNEPATSLPESVQRLYPREREIATAVYRRGRATAKEVEAVLSTTLTNGSVRCMLNRLVRKGILARRRSGKHREFMYVASVTNAQVVEDALRQFAQDFFGGSLHRSAIAMVDLLQRERDQGSPHNIAGSAARQGIDHPQKQLAA